MMEKIDRNNTFQLFLREWREHRGLTQDQLAQRVGRSKGQISGWESGSRGLRQSVAAELAVALGISINDLYRDPIAPSADELLRNAPAEVRELAIDLIKVLLKRLGQ
ncbi:MAG: helix-turn-helix transcriptional regulator [Burkholderiales bacterium]|nr:helix-turn-helix transcriptional regulator [Burkholderiales bacterium]